MRPWYALFFLFALGSQTYAQQIFESSDRDCRDQWAFTKYDLTKNAGALNRSILLIFVQKGKKVCLTETSEEQVNAAGCPEDLDNLQDLPVDDKRRWRFLNFDGVFKFKSMGEKFLTVVDTSVCHIGLRVSSPDAVQTWQLKQ